MKAPFLADVRQLARTASQRGMLKALTCLDRRLACIELVGWPALEQSLRAELEEAISIARSRGFRVPVPAHERPKHEQSWRSFLTCGVCGLRVNRHGSRRVIHAGVRKHVCPKCAKAVKA